MTFTEFILADNLSAAGWRLRRDEFGELIGGYLEYHTVLVRHSCSYASVLLLKSGKMSRAE
jgi:hypothetical protein